MLSSTPFSESRSVQAVFLSVSRIPGLCSPGVLLGADSVGLLAILGGLLHGVHDLAVLLGEGHNPEMEECLVEFFMFDVHEEEGRMCGEGMEGNSEAFPV